MKLYDLLILTFSENGKLADLDALRTKSGVSAEEWDDLLQYTSQVRPLYHPLPHYMRGADTFEAWTGAERSGRVGSEQPGEL